MMGIGVLAAAIPVPEAQAYPAIPDAPAGPVPAPAAPAGAASGAYLFYDEFDGPAGSTPNPGRWTVSNYRTPIKTRWGLTDPSFGGSTATVAKTCSSTATPISFSAPQERAPPTSAA